MLGDYQAVFANTLNPKLTQKCLQSFEGLCISYDKTLAYVADSAALVQVSAAILKLTDLELLPVQHCAEQALTSILNNQYFERHRAAFDGPIKLKINQFSKKAGIKPPFLEIDK